MHGNTFDEDFPNVPFVQNCFVLCSMCQIFPLCLLEISASQFVKTRSPPVWKYYIAACVDGRPQPGHGVHNCMSVRWMDADHIDHGPGQQSFLERSPRPVTPDLWAMFDDVLNLNINTAAIVKPRQRVRQCNGTLGKVIERSLEVNIASKNLGLCGASSNMTYRSGCHSVSADATT